MRDINDIEYSRYARRLNETDMFNEDEGYEVINLIKALTYHFNLLLKTQGYVLLNDVYESLGLSRIEEYDNVGWLYNEDNPVGDNFVNVSIYTVFSFMCGIDKDCIILDFNVDGVIRH